MRLLYHTNQEHGQYKYASKRLVTVTIIESGQESSDCVVSTY